MRISLNLASRPYIELRSILARLRIIALALFVLGGAILLVVRVEENKAAIAQAKVQQLETNIAALQAAQTRAHTLAAQGPNAKTFVQADFLNDLFRRKAFSWTATMSDLETVLPAGVQVLYLNPIVMPDGHVAIQLRVAGPRERAVDVVRNLEHSKHFLAPHLLSETLASKEGQQGLRNVANGGPPADVSFDILATYKPLASSHEAAAGSQATPAKTAASSKTAELTNPNGTVPAPPAAPRRHRKKLPGTPMSAPQGGKR